MSHCHQTYFTVTSHVCVLPSAEVAVIVALPRLTVVSAPVVGSTLTTLSLDELHVTVSDAFSVNEGFFGT